MTKGLASEMAEYNVRVNALAPGLVVTPINKPLRDDPAWYRRLHCPHGAQAVGSAIRRWSVRFCYSRRMRAAT